MSDTINTFEQLVKSGGGIAILFYRDTSRERGGRGAKFAVIRVNAKGQQLITDRNAHWTDYGKKAFHVGLGVKKPEALAEAQAWVRDIYGIAGPWVRNRMGDYVLAEVNARFPLPKPERQK
jgi:hypothetical protein